MAEQFTAEKDPSASLTYVMDWTAYLAALGSTISSSSWIVPAELTTAGTGNTTTKASIKLSGGKRGKDYWVTNRIVTANGETEERSFILKIREQ